MDGGEEEVRRLLPGAAVRGDVEQVAVVGDHAPEGLIERCADEFEGDGGEPLPEPLPPVGDRWCQPEVSLKRAKSSTRRMNSGVRRKRLAMSG